MDLNKQNIARALADGNHSTYLPTRLSQFHRRRSCHKIKNLSNLTNGKTLKKYDLILLTWHKGEP